MCVSAYVCSGVGKGMFGAVALPTGGVIDFGTHAFESVHRFIFIITALFSPVFLE